MDHLPAGFSVSKVASQSGDGDSWGDIPSVSGDSCDELEQEVQRSTLPNGSLNDGGGDVTKRQIKKKSKWGRIASDITKEELATCFGMPSEDAAKKLGVGLTVLKRICRKFGVPRWPYRKLKSLDRLIENVETGVAPGETYKHLMKSADEIKERQRAMCAGHLVELDDQTKKLQQAYSKFNHKQRKVTEMPDSGSISDSERAKKKEKTSMQAKYPGGAPGVPHPHSYMSFDPSGMCDQERQMMTMMHMGFPMMLVDQQTMVASQHMTSFPFPTMPGYVQVSRMGVDQHADSLKSAEDLQSASAAVASTSAPAAMHSSDTHAAQPAMPGWPGMYYPENYWSSSGDEQAQPSAAAPSAIMYPYGLAAGAQIPSMAAAYSMLPGARAMPPSPMMGYMPYGAGYMPQVGMYDQYWRVQQQIMQMQQTQQQHMAAAQHAALAAQHAASQQQVPEQSAHAMPETADAEHNSNHQVDDIHMYSTTNSQPMQVELDMYHHHHPNHVKYDEPNPGVLPTPAVTAATPSVPSNNQGMTSTAFNTATPNEDQVNATPTSHVSCMPLSQEVVVRPVDGGALPLSSLFSDAAGTTSLSSDQGPSAVEGKALREHTKELEPACLEGAPAARESTTGEHTSPARPLEYRGEPTSSPQATCLPSSSQHDQNRPPTLPEEQPLHYNQMPLYAPMSMLAGSTTELGVEVGGCGGESGPRPAPAPTEPDKVAAVSPDVNAALHGAHVVHYFVPAVPDDEAWANVQYRALEMGKLVRKANVCPLSRAVGITTETVGAFPTGSEVTDDDALAHLQLYTLSLGYVLKGAVVTAIQTSEQGGTASRTWDVSNNDARCNCNGANGSNSGQKRKK